MFPSVLNMPLYCDAEVKLNPDTLKLNPILQTLCLIQLYSFLQTLM